MTDEEKRGRGSLIGGMVIAIVLAGTIAWYVWEQLDRLPDEAAFELNGEVVTEDELDEEIATLKTMYGLQVPEDEEELQDFHRDAAKASVVNRLLAAEADERGLVATEQEVEQQLQAYIARLYPDAEKPAEQFTKELAQAGTSRTAVLEEMSRRLETDKLLNEVAAEVEPPTATEIEDAFAERECTLQVPQSRQLRNIVVKTKGEAKAVLKQLKQGKNFASLAKSASADTSTSNNGGKIGIVLKKQLDPAYGKVAFQAKEKAYFGPVESASGWNVGQVIKIVPPQKLAYKDVSKSLGQQLLLERQSKAWQDDLQAMLNEAEVQYADAYLPDDATSLPDGISSWGNAQEGKCASGQVVQ